MIMPDPDSAEIGFLVDGWLTSLRESGMSPSRRERRAKYLGLMSTRNWEPATRFQAQVLASFQSWIQEHPLAKNSAPKQSN